MTADKIPLVVLLVEDSEDDAWLIARELQNGGYAPAVKRVKTIASLQAALTSQTWDIILSDYRMPGFDGLSVLKTVRAQLPEAPFILVSGAIGEDTAVTVMKAGAQDYVIKDNLTRLVPAVKRELGETALRQEHQRAEIALRESEHKFALIYEKAPYALALASLPEGTILNVNEAFEKMFGFTRQESIGKSSLELGIYRDPQSRPLLQTGLQTQDFSDAIEGVFFTKTGLQRIGSCNREIILLNGKQHLLSMMQDITERRQTEQNLLDKERSLQQANAELQIANETLESRVAARTADLMHQKSQLRALASAITNAEERERFRISQIIHDELQQLLVAANYKLGLAQSHSSGTTKNLLKSIGDLIRDSLDSSRSLTAELSPAVLRRSNLREHLEWLVDWFKEKHDLIVKIEVRHEIEVSTDEIRITLFRVVRELLFNAVKHAQVKNILVQLDQTNTGEAQIIVCDKGVGFDPEATRTKEGVMGGFGLFSVRERLELLGATLKVESTPRVGSRFTIQFANNVLVPETFTKRQARRTLAPRRRGSRKIRVLLVDDHAIVRKDLKVILTENADLEVVGEAGNGRQAFERVKKLQPDVVVMDLNMPEVDGIEATRLIIAEFPRVKVIGISTQADKGQRLAILEAGAVAFVLKSSPPSKIVAAIRKLLPR